MFIVNELGLAWRAEKTYIDAIMNKLHKSGYVADELIAKLREMKKPPAPLKEYPNVDERKLEAMFEFVKQDRPDYYKAFMYMKKTGRRVEETTLYHRSDIIWKPGRLRPLRINVRPSTTKIKYKWLPLSDLNKDLEDLLISACTDGQEKNEPYLFLNRRGKRIQQSKARDYLKKVSLEYLDVVITPHYFRHRFMTLCALGGVPMRDAMAIAGISDMDTAMKYYMHSTAQGRAMALEIS